jgi:hypothetical protein
MLFDFNQSKDLSTPTIHYGGVDKINPLLTSSDIFSLDDNDVYFSSILSKKNEHELVTKDNINENIDNHQEQQDDLFSTFDFPVLSELDKTGKIIIPSNVNIKVLLLLELFIDAALFNKYITQTSFPSPAMDECNSSICDDVTSSALPWVGEECTVESQHTEDMMVPPSPSLSSTSSSVSISRPKSKKKSSLSTIERKLRKKGQNKSAAEKYRTKKRAEREELTTRHSDLKNQNRELKFELENIRFQLEQFKQLFVDVLQLPIPSNNAN